MYRGLEYSTNDPEGYIYRAQITSPPALNTQSYQSPTLGFVSPAAFIDFPVINGSEFALENIFTATIGSAIQGAIQLFLNRQLVVNEIVPYDFQAVPPASTASALSGLTLRTVFAVKFDLIRCWTLANAVTITWLVQIATGDAGIVQIQR
jgi:hypothetical protein